MSENEFVTVGRLGRARGLEGEIYITPHTDFPDRFLGMTEIMVKSKQGWETLKIESVRMVGKRPVVKFESVGSPEEAARLTNRDVAVTKEEVVPLPEGEFYIFDLEGCDVYDAQTDQLVGKITEVTQYPASDVYTIKTTDSLEMLVPAVSEFVKKIDIENRRVEIVTAGLLKT